MQIYIWASFPPGNIACSTQNSFWLAVRHICICITFQLNMCISIGVAIAFQPLSIHLPSFHRSKTEQVFGDACRFSTKHTRPDGIAWEDPFQLTDGHWGPDGHSIIVSDVAGQMHLYALNGLSDSMRCACYDQFFSSDYGRLRRDANHYVVDDVTQQPPHIRTSEYVVLNLQSMISGLFPGLYDPPCAQPQEMCHGLHASCWLNRISSCFAPCSSVWDGSNSSSCAT